MDKTRKYRLVSDFTDYYDSLFETDPKLPVLQRLRNKDMTGEEMLEFLRNHLKFLVPISGKVKNLCAQTVLTATGHGPCQLTQLPGSTPLTIYLSGRQQTVMPARQALEQYPDNDSSLAIVTRDSICPKTYRYIHVGRRGFVYRTYFVENEPTEYEFVQELDPGYKPDVRHPLYAVDFTCFLGMSSTGGYSTSFTTCPNLKEIGLDAIMTAESVHAELTVAADFYWRLAMLEQEGFDLLSGISTPNNY